MITAGQHFSYALIRELLVELEKKGIETTYLSDLEYLRIQTAFECITPEEQTYFKKLASNAINEIFIQEPSLASLKQTVCIELTNAANIKDTRDIICRSLDGSWEMGISCGGSTKVRHARLFSSSLAIRPETSIKDVGLEWIGHTSNERYFTRMRAYAEKFLELKGREWKGNFRDKATEVYAPVLDALKENIVSICNTYPDAPEKMIKYFFGDKDFYEITPVRKTGKVTITCYNMNGTLNKGVEHKQSSAKYPTELIEIRPKTSPSGELSQTTLSLFFDNGWLLEMRLHNASARIVPETLVFDVSIKGYPYGIYQVQV